MTARPTPDDLLARVQAEEAQKQRGTLKIFFGYAAGVGKTYAMLETAQRARAAGQDIVVGYVEPHGRAETEALLEGLETLSQQPLDYRGVTLREFDIDAALRRHPEIILVDELAHTNAAGSRHAKRWQDVEELRGAGIEVWSTLNVQHIESLNDVIAQVTGIAVRETVPDSIIESADELELIDIPPEELLSRLQAGRIYLPEQARRAAGNFFQKTNLSALRELSLRHAAQRVHQDVELGRRERSVLQSWATGERLLVCVGPSPTTTRVIRTAKRMAAALDAPWLAVAIELNSIADSPSRQEQIARHFRLAEQLGAETITLSGSDFTTTLLDYARSRNVTKIFIGKTRHPRWKRLFGSIVDDVLEQSGDIDVYIIHGEAGGSPIPRPWSASRDWPWRPYLMSLAAIAMGSGVAWLLKHLQVADAEANTVMVFLAAVAVSAYWLGRGPAVFASIVAVLTFDFCFVPPLWTFAVADTQYVVTFAVMLSIALGISTLTSRLKTQVERTRLREQRTAALYHLGQQLSSLSGSVFLVAVAGKEIADLCGGEVAIYLREPSGPPRLLYGERTRIATHPVSQPAAHWVIEHDQLAGAGTSTLPNAIALFFPITASQETTGALAILVPDVQRLLEPDQRRLLEACANQLALALERDRLAIDAAESRIRAEAEQVRSTLLSSVSHDLKTPLAAIAGASSSLLQTPSLPEEVRRQLLESVAEEAQRLNRLLENILQMSRLDAGAVSPNKQWHVLEEIVGSALHRTASELKNHPVKVQLPNDLPLMLFDGLLLEQLLVNLLENAARYTPPGTTVCITAAIDSHKLRLTVSDAGPGLEPGTEKRIFEKFYRASPGADSGRGSGLGLAICQAIVQAHGGQISASNRPGGGAEFVAILPLAPGAPHVPLEETTQST
ncbi:sensor histidine kinase [Planctomicrobium piriforme]|uniref:histidine kinase n=1 Tax=Planctomicrobium piriforme TaxID=1576369 RepID=A0A1I3SXX1_9PLAN|nr:sensor histidine kinase KdpD [Planctomicrobium piriforme]SFJ63595.1 two-component system, OmpR family, sensor histidine kinase KdpD [Planctomicrobium piriforme]